MSADPPVPAQNFRDWIRDAVNEHFAPDGLEATDEAIDQLAQILECRAEELAEHALADLRGRLAQIITKWYESGDWEIEQGSREFGQGLYQCADDLKAVLAPASPERPDDHVERIK
jgi:hypothetical protein